MIKFSKDGDDIVITIKAESITHDKPLYLIGLNPGPNPTAIAITNADMRQVFIREYPREIFPR